MEEDDLLSAIFDADPTLGSITAEKVEAVLSGFPLEPQRSHEWLARAIQVALYLSAPTAEQDSDRQGNKDVGRELAALAEQSAAAWRALLSISPAAESALMDHAHHTAAPTDGDDFSLPAEFLHFRTTLLHMERVNHLLADAARAVREDKQPPNWRRREKREERIRRAHALSTIYEEAFGAVPFINNWQDAPLGNWADFYQRIVALAFGEKVTPDLVEVLKEGRRRHKERRVVFAAGILNN